MAKPSLVADSRQFHQSEELRFTRKSAHTCWASVTVTASVKIPLFLHTPEAIVARKGSMAAQVPTLLEGRQRCSLALGMSLPAPVRQRCAHGHGA